MTLVLGDLKLVTNEPAAVSEAWVRADRPRMHGTAYVTDGNDHIHIKDSLVEFEALPGPAVMMLVSGGMPIHTVKMIVPDKPTATLRECIEAVGLVDDGTADTLTLLAQRVAADAARVGTAAQVETWAGEAQEAAGRVGTASQVEEWAQRSESAAGRSSTAAANASRAADRSEEAKRGAEGAAGTIPGRVSSEVNKQVPPAVTDELQTRLPQVVSDEVDTQLPGKLEPELDQRVPPVVADYLGGDTVIRDAAAAAVEPLAQGAVDAAADEIKWYRGEIPRDADLNDYIVAGAYEVPTYTVANSLANRPPNEAIQAASVTVTENGSEGIHQRWQKISLVGQDQVEMARHRDQTGAWDKWVKIPRQPEITAAITAATNSVAWSKGEIPRDADLNDYTHPGTYEVPTWTVANSLINQPPPEAIQSASLTIAGTGRGSVKQRWEKISLVGQDQVIRERHLDPAGDWSAWRIPNESDLRKLGDGVSPAAKMTMLRQQSRLRRGGRVGTAGRTPVSLSFDHGFVNFRDRVLPHLIRLGLPATVAVNSDTLNVPGGESDGVTFADLQEWSLSHGIEIAHHGRSHGDVPGASPEGLANMLTSTIPEFQEEMPDVVADAFIMPGASGTKYEGFNAGLPPENWWTHRAGRMILENFPVVTAAMLGQAVPVTGEPVQTIDRAGVDITSWAKVAEDKIEACYGTGLGIAVFNHPSKIGDSITEERLTQFLEFLAAERDAGRVEVLTISGFAWADARDNYGADLAQLAGWPGATAVIALDPMLTNFKGGQVAVMGQATTTGTVTITATDDTGTLTAGGSVAVTAGKPVYVPFSIPKSSTTITVTCPESITNRRVMPV